MSNCTGWPLPKMVWMLDGSPFQIGERGAFIVLAGQPDADAAWETSMRLAVASAKAGKLVVVVDATASNPLPDGVLGLYLDEFEFVTFIVREVEWSPGDVIVLHSLDAWSDWADSDGVMADLAAAVGSRGLTVLLHTKVLHTGLIFGDRVIGRFPSVVLSVNEADGCRYICGGELMQTRDEASRDSGAPGEEAQP